MQVGCLLSAISGHRRCSASVGGPAILTSSLVSNKIFIFASWHSVSMNWRQQIDAVLCGMLFLAVMAAVAIRTMVPDVARVEFKAADTPASQPTFVRSFVEFIRERGAPNRSRRELKKGGPEAS